MSNRQRIVGDDEIDKALDWLRDSAQAIGDAKARMVKAGHMIKHIEAIETKLSNEASVAARRVDALCSLRYLAAIDEDAAATGEYQKLVALREAATLRIDAWRTESSNYRSMKI